MNEQPTPETDAFTSRLFDAQWPVEQRICVGDFARKLERERDAARAKRDEAAEEKARRIYYQNIVYFVCNLIDRETANKPGNGVVCGTADAPSTEVQSSLSALVECIKKGANQELAAIEAAIEKEWSLGDNALSDDILDNFAAWVDHHAVVEQERNALRAELATLRARGLYTCLTSTEEAPSGVCLPHLNKQSKTETTNTSISSPDVLSGRES